MSGVPRFGKGTMVLMFSGRCCLHGARMNVLERTNYHYDILPACYGEPAESYHREAPWRCQII